MGWLNKQEFDKMLNKICWIISEFNIKCMCGRVFNVCDIDYKKDPDDEYWIFANCKKCGYDYSYPKIMNQFMRDKYE